MIDAAQFWTDGFVVLRGVFAPDEVEAARSAALKLSGSDLFAVDALRRVMLDSRVLAIARDILETPELVYFGDSNPLVGQTDAGFHRDNADKLNQEGPDWSGRYPIIRFGLYTQDHAEGPGGLDVRAGSHRECADRGRYRAADTRVGDLVVWNLRTLHSGDTMRLRNGTAIDPDSVRGKVLRRWPLGLLRQMDAIRVAIFWSFAVAGPHLERYIAYLKTRTYAVERWMEAPYDPDAVVDAERRGMHIRQVRKELDGNLPKLLHQNHVPLPW